MTPGSPGGPLPTPRNLGRDLPPAEFGRDQSFRATDPDQTRAVQDERGEHGRVTELDEVPGLAGVYARGVAGSVALAVRRERSVRPNALVPSRLRVRGVRPDAEHLTAYQHLVGESADDTLPPGFAHVLAFPLAMSLLADDTVPLPLLGMVHLANRITQHRELTLGEDLDVTVGTAGLRAHRSGVSIDVVAEVGPTGGDVVWRGVSTYLAKGYRLEVSGDGHDADAAGSRPAFTPPVPTGQWRLDPDVARRYAVVSGDRNPIHLSSVAAKAFGFPRRIAHGMYTAARALADVGPRLRGEAFTWSVEFARPVLLPSKVAVRIEGGTDREGGGASGSGGASMALWDPRSGKPHLLGSVVPA